MHNNTNNIEAQWLSFCTFGLKNKRQMILKEKNKDLAQQKKHLLFNKCLYELHTHTHKKRFFLPPIITNIVHLQNK